MTTVVVSRRLHFITLWGRDACISRRRYPASFIIKLRKRSGGLLPPHIIVWRSVFIPSLGVALNVACDTKFV
jgi:hypothetical protein